MEKELRMLEMVFQRYGALANDLFFFAKSMFAFLSGKNLVDHSVLPTPFQSPMNCIFVHASSTHDFGAMRSDCLLQFSILYIFSDPHEFHFRSCILHP